MIHDELVTYEVAKLAKEKGFDVYCDYTYYNHYRVRDEIQIKHPYLSDDGYEDLRKIYGGPYYDNELYGYYIEALALHSKNSTIGINPITKKPCATAAICAAPTQSLLQRWLREEKGIHIEIVATACGYFWIADKTNGTAITDSDVLDRGTNEGGCWDEYELALEDALKYALENLI